MNLEVDDDKNIIQVHDLWIKLRKRGRNIRVNLDEAERELVGDEESWLRRLKPQ